MRYWLATVALFILMPPAMAVARFEGPSLSGGCSNPEPEHGYCSSLVAERDGVFVFELRSYARGGPVELCIQFPGGGHQCKHRHLRFDSKLNAWVSRIPSPDSVRGYGDYSARWLDPESGRRLGRPMEYSVGTEANPPR
jgi:hypothetical protein